MVLEPDEAFYLATGSADAFTKLYARHRVLVREALESAGLDREQAESQVVVVFVRMIDLRTKVDRSKPLGDSLREHAHDVARRFRAGESARVTQ
jgi:hypothetical protein